MINSIISYIFGFIKICIYKLINKNRIYFHKTIKINFSTNFYINKKSKVILGKYFRSRNNVSIYCCDNGQISISDNVFLNDNCVLSCRESIIIGSGCLFGNNVSIYDNDHDYRKNLNKYKTNPVHIGNNVWIGCNAVILRGAKIGNNCVIAAGTIVKGEIPDNSLVYNSKEMVIKEMKGV